MTMAVVFDVNETLLDLAALDPAFRQLLGVDDGRERWFRQLLQLSLVATVTGEYAPFDALGDAALAQVAGQLRVRVSDADRARLRGLVRTLPLHDDVRPALERLRAAGLRVAALTNSTAETVEAQLAHAGVRDRFERLLSVDAVRRYKPAPETYRHAAAQLGIAPGELCLVAAHAWDVAGAQAAGCRAAFVQRPGKSLSPLQRAPDVAATDLRAVAEAIVALDR